MDQKMQLDATAHEKIWSSQKKHANARQPLGAKRPLEESAKNEGTPMYKRRRSLRIGETVQGDLDPLGEAKVRSALELLTDPLLAVLKRSEIRDANTFSEVLWTWQEYAAALESSQIATRHTAELGVGMSSLAGYELGIGLREAEEAMCELIKETRDVPTEISTLIVTFFMPCWDLMMRQFSPVTYSTRDARLAKCLQLEHNVRNLDWHTLVGAEGATWDIVAGRALRAPIRSVNTLLTDDLRADLTFEGSCVAQGSNRSTIDQGDILILSHENRGRISQVKFVVVFGDNRGDVLNAQMCVVFGKDKGNIRGCRVVIVRDGTMDLNGLVEHNDCVQAHQLVVDRIDDMVTIVQGSGASFTLTTWSNSTSSSTSVFFG